MLIVLDTLRFDHALVFTKMLKKYNFRFYSKVIAPAPWTFPSHASLFTGLYPIQHGAHETKKKKLGDMKKGISFLTSIKLNKPDFLITKDLKDLGYKTHLYSANPLISDIFGFKFWSFKYNYEPLSPFISADAKIRVEKMLAEYNSRVKVIKKLVSNKEYGLALRIILHSMYWRYTNLKKHLMSRFPPKIILDKGAKNVISSIKKHVPKPSYFIFVNFMEMHEPYFFNRENLISSSVNFKKEVRKKINIPLVRKAYYQDAIYLSNKLDKLLSKSNELDKTLIIILSDHGQLLGEKDRYGHGIFFRR